MIEAIIAFLVAHSSFFSFLFGGSAAGGGAYVYFKEEINNARLSVDRIAQERDRFQRDVARGREQNQELIRRNAELSEQLQVKKIEMAKYKVLYQSLVEIHQRGQKSNLSSAEINEVIKKALKDFMSSLVSEYEEKVSLFLVDPITRELYSDPIVLPSGYTLNAGTVNEIYRTQRQPRCPITRMALPDNPHSLPKNRAVLDLLAFLNDLGLNGAMLQMVNDENQPEQAATQQDEQIGSRTRVTQPHVSRPANSSPDGTQIRSSEVQQSATTTSSLPGFYQRAYADRLRRERGGAAPAQVASTQHSFH